MDQETTYALHEFAAEAIKRSELFSSVVQQDGFTVLPGRYGGEFNNDMLAIRQNEDTTLLMLGLKVTGESGELQMDLMSIGPHQQLSPPWLSTVVFALQQSAEYNHFAGMISSAIAKGNLVTGVLYLSRMDKTVHAVRVGGVVNDAQPIIPPDAAR